MGPHSIRISISHRTFLRALIWLVFAAVLIRIAPLLLLSFISVLVAVTLDPARAWLREKGLPSWAALSVVIGTLVGGVAIFFFVLIPNVVSELSAIGENAEALKGLFGKYVPAGPLRDFVHKITEKPELVFGEMSKHIAFIGGAIVSGIWSACVMLILAAYLLIDGTRAWRWLRAFFNEENRRKLDRTAEEVRPVVFAYVAGQLITCCIVAVFAFVVANFLHVPAAFTLATLAAIFDVLPIVGFLTSAATAGLLALTVSPQTALLIVALYIAYQGFENYVLIPHIYGKRLKLSTLAVLVSFMIAGLLAGIVGMIAALPIAAAYPTIEKYWLKKHVGEETVRAHQAQAPMDA